MASTLAMIVAEIRKEDLEAGARIGSMVPLQDKIDAGTLVVEEARPRMH